jgi:hypothetical protein
MWATLSSSSCRPQLPTIQRSCSAGLYIYSQWLDGGHDVEILRPGYWSDTEQRVEEEG